MLWNNSVQLETELLMSLSCSKLLVHFLLFSHWTTIFSAQNSLICEKNNDNLFWYVCTKHMHSNELHCLHNACMYLIGRSQCIVKCAFFSLEWTVSIQFCKEELLHHQHQIHRHCFHVLVVNCYLPVLPPVSLPLDSQTEGSSGMLHHFFVPTQLRPLQW